MIGLAQLIEDAKASGVAALSLPPVHGASIVLLSDVWYATIEEDIDNGTALVATGLEDAKTEAHAHYLALGYKRISDWVLFESTDLVYRCSVL